MSKWFNVASALIDNIDDPCLQSLLALTSKHTMNRSYEHAIHPVVLSILFQLHQNQEADFYVTQRLSKNHSHIRHVFVGQNNAGLIMMWIGDAKALEFESANSLARHLNNLATAEDTPLIFQSI